VILSVLTNCSVPSSVALLNDFLAAVSCACGDELATGRRPRLWCTQ